MKLKIFLSFLISSTTLQQVAVTSLPINVETNFELTSNHFEGDMILSAEMEQILAMAEVDSNNGTAFKKRPRRNALIDKDYRWPHGIVYYQISREFSSIEIRLIYQAMQHISSNTCIRFHSIDENESMTAAGGSGYSKTFVFIRPSSRGCSAAVGYQAGGIQFINLVPMRGNSVGCFRLGIIVHELLHALGIYHQHSSADRDDYVRIRSENIRPGTEHNFRKLPSAFASSFGIDYDYASVMHYNCYAFSWNGEPTIEPLNSYASHMIGQRRGLSGKDILKIQRMYECE